MITSKIILGTQFRRSHNCLHSETGNSVFIRKSMTTSSCLLGVFINFYTFSELKWNHSAPLHYALISVQNLTQVIKSNTSYRSSNNTKRQQKNRTSKRQLEGTGIKKPLIKKDFPIIMSSWEMPLSLAPDFTNEKIVKNIIQQWANPTPLKKFENHGEETYHFYFNKMKPSLNASKLTDYSWWFLKSELKVNYKNIKILK